MKNSAFYRSSFCPVLLGYRGTINGHLVNYYNVNPDPDNLPGELTINGSYTQESSGILTIGLGGSTQGVDYDWLNVIGTANLSGSLDIYLYDDFTPTFGETFSILTATDGISGTFDSYAFPNSLGTSWDVAYNTNSVVLKYIGDQPSPTPEPATLVLFGFGLIGLVALVEKNSGATFRE